MFGEAREAEKKARERPMAEQVPADRTKGQLHDLFGCSWLAWRCYWSGWCPQACRNYSTESSIVEPCERR